MTLQLNLHQLGCHDVIAVRVLRKRSRIHARNSARAVIARQAAPSTTVRRPRDRRPALSSVIAHVWRSPPINTVGNIMTIEKVPSFCWPWCEFSHSIIFTPAGRARNWRGWRLKLSYISLVTFSFALMRPRIILTRELWLLRCSLALVFSFFCFAS